MEEVCITRTILVGAVITLFIISAGIGYCWQDLISWKDKKVQEHRNDAFVPPAVPKEIVEAFSREFNLLQAATDYKTLPNEPFKTANRADKRFSDFAGRPTLVNFWATWCAPCVIELPSLQKLKEDYDGRLNVVAIALEEGKTPEDIAAFLDRRGVGDFAQNLDLSGQIGRNLSMRGIPTSFLIGSDGVILYRFEGDANWASAKSREFFDALLLQKR